jgi:IstB-like ATP binding protein
MSSSVSVEAARLELMLTELRLPAIKAMWATIAAQSDKEGWPAARLLAALTEHEMAERSRRRIERHLAEARLPIGKTFDSFDFDAVPIVSKAQVMALASGDSWIDKGANLLLFGPPGAGKSTSPPRSASRSSRTAIACCSPEPAISCSGSNSSLTWGFRLSVTGPGAATARAVRIRSVAMLAKKRRMSCLPEPCPGLSISAPRSPHYARPPGIAGEQDRTSGKVVSMETEDGCLWICGMGDQGTIASTSRGVEVFGS